MIVGVASVGHAGVIGDFEGTSLDGWEPGGQGGVVTLANSTTAGTVTLGSQSLKVDFTAAGYWVLLWAAPSVPSFLTSLKFDLSMIASEWPDEQWTKVADKIALNSDSPDGWSEYVASAANWSWRDPSNPEPCPVDWGAYDGDAFKTYTMDISDYDLTGATWFTIAISMQQDPGAYGSFYIDNVRFSDVANTPTPENEGLGFVDVTDTLHWNNAVSNMSLLKVWFGEGKPSVTDANQPNEDNYKDKLALIQTIPNPDPNTSIEMPTIFDGVDYTWVVDGYIYGPDADPNVYLGPLWTFYATTNISPTADAGDDQYKWLVPPDPNVVITLDGSASNDPDSGPSPMTYSWTQIAGPTVTIDTPDAETSTVTLTGGLANTTEAGASAPYQFQLEVDDGQFSDTNVVTVSVNSNSCTATIESGGYYYWGDIAGSGGGGDDYRDCEVDLYDLIELALNWLGCSNVFEACD